MKNFIFILCLFLCLSKMQFAKAEENSIIVGWIERVRIEPVEMIMHAKIDTGADNCSIHAEKISLHKEENEETFAEFFLENHYGKSDKLKLKVIRTAKIKTKRGGIQSRPVVSIGICLDSIFEYIECNLVDRSHFKYPVLLGRNFLASNVLVDSAETYLSEPKCKIEK